MFSCCTCFCLCLLLYLPVFSWWGYFPDLPFCEFLLAFSPRKIINFLSFGRYLFFLFVRARWNDKSVLLFYSFQFLFPLKILPVCKFYIPTGKRNKNDFFSCKHCIKNYFLRKKLRNYLLIFKMFPTLYVVLIYLTVKLPTWYSKRR